MFLLFVNMNLSLLFTNMKKGLRTLHNPMIEREGRFYWLFVQSEITSQNLCCLGWWGVLTFCLNWWSRLESIVLFIKKLRDSLVHCQKVDLVGAVWCSPAGVANYRSWKHSRIWCQPLQNWCWHISCSDRLDGGNVCYVDSNNDEVVVDDNGNYLPKEVRERRRRKLYVHVDLGYLLVCWEENVGGWGGGKWKS